MADASNKKDILLQNLQDAGCDSNIIFNCVTLVEKSRIADVIQLLKGYRTDLLNKVHKNQDKLDCLDFLIYKLQKEYN